MWIVFFLCYFMVVVCMFVFIVWGVFVIGFLCDFFVDFLVYELCVVVLFIVGSLVIVVIFCFVGIYFWWMCVVVVFGLVVVLVSVGSWVLF